MDFSSAPYGPYLPSRSGQAIWAALAEDLQPRTHDHPRARRRVVVCREPRALKTEGGIDVLPTRTFVRKLWEGELIEGGLT